MEKERNLTNLISELNEDSQGNIILNHVLELPTGHLKYALIIQETIYLMISENLLESADEMDDAMIELYKILKPSKFIKINDQVNENNDDNEKLCFNDLNAKFFNGSCEDDTVNTEQDKISNKPIKSDCTDLSNSKMATVSVSSRCCIRSSKSKSEDKLVDGLESHNKNIRSKFVNCKSKGIIFPASKARCNVVRNRMNHAFTKKFGNKQPLDYFNKVINRNLKDEKTDSVVIPVSA